MKKEWGEPGVMGIPLEPPTAKLTETPLDLILPMDSSETLKEMGSDRGDTRKKPTSKIGRALTGWKLAESAISFSKMR